MNTINRKLGYQVTAGLAELRKTGGLNSVEYRQLHKEAIDVFTTDKDIDSESLLRAVYGVVERNYLAARVTLEIASDAIAVDRNMLIRTVEVLQQELKAGNIDRPEFDKLNRERQSYFGLISNCSCSIPADAPIAQHYKEAQKLPEKLHEPLVANEPAKEPLKEQKKPSTATDTTKNVDEKPTAKIETKPATIQPIVAMERNQHRGTELLDSPLDVLLSRDTKSK